ncbi:hypothetical protein AD45P2_00180 [Alteromonas phage vB_AmaP_AD45-P2]|uniref:Uncharacterized protein n=1 Tax=Pseudorhizobium pelagicum TaxID=1509405 RepID=A0A922TAD5_9HYPH|nr:hypothetical protein [Pseudorhizobium pelagicum]YP_008126008.1 hypothetical protein M610_gp037 [Alteromonas phage vB_AmaP_AD45-P1]AGM46975.1 hypothetical protein AD45P3_00185 [Alteromonas phage vB_AmaP_AD45-P3]AGM47092.1 hypothetical protein AD45P4_00185 [Alteromonas phage vB_AmaP_AD45-P4]AGM47207.1 hypothetical protein AD45P2_00180 [Alteromonas phage vB_AmaP_AD45-P2]AGM46855.1 hypothetical protein AD45P1_00185 [Alteromonas phage vB_AmaP_AD45-P1]KEQ05555.1 hypothetical protein GV68_08475 [
MAIASYDAIKMSLEIENAAREELRKQRSYTLYFFAKAIADKEATVMYQSKGIGILGAKLVWKDGTTMLIDHKTYKALFKDKMIGLMGLTLRHRELKLWNTQDLPWKPASDRLTVEQKLLEIPNGS